MDGTIYQAAPTESLTARQTLSEALRGYVLSEFFSPAFAVDESPGVYAFKMVFKEGKQVRQMKTLTGAEIVIECLKEQGVDTVFGYPGGAILNIYDALYKHKDEITHILNLSPEQGSVTQQTFTQATSKSQCV